MYVSGKDIKNNYDYWAIDVENPISQFDSVATLMVSNNGIATSGVNKRRWKNANEDKNHLIDLKTQHSLKTELQTATVIASNAVDADVFAKTILILGVDAGLEFANSKSLASLIIDKNLQLFKSKEMEKYVWKN
jgi:thiamine biosynthesis lipoprotein